MFIKILGARKITQPLCGYWVSECSNTGTWALTAVRTLGHSRLSTIFGIFIMNEIRFKKNIVYVSNTTAVHLHVHSIHSYRSLVLMSEYSPMDLRLQASVHIFKARLITDGSNTGRATSAREIKIKWFGQVF